MEIFLKFNKDNNFCTVCEKYGIQGEQLEIGRMVSWMINNAEISIQEAYLEGAPRRIQMEKLCADLRKQLMSQLTQDEIDEIKIGIQPLVLGDGFN